jgi:hypothetical protein
VPRFPATAAGPKCRAAEAAVDSHACDGIGMTPHHVRGPPVGAHPVSIGALLFQQQRDLLQRVGDFLVVRRLHGQRILIDLPVGHGFRVRVIIAILPPTQSIRFTIVGSSISVIASVGVGQPSIDRVFQEGPPFTLNKDVADASARRWFPIAGFRPHPAAPGIRLL